MCIRDSSCSWRATSGFNSSGTLYAFWRFGLKSGVTCISCMPTLHKTDLSTNTSENSSNSVRNSCFCPGDRWASFSGCIFSLGSGSHCLTQFVYQPLVKYRILHQSHKQLHSCLQVLRLLWHGKVSVCLHATTSSDLVLILPNMSVVLFYPLWFLDLAIGS